MQPREHGTSQLPEIHTVNHNHFQTEQNTGSQTVTNKDSLTKIPSNNGLNLPDIENHKPYSKH